MALSVMPNTGPAAQQLTDPGPVWNGITDTTAFRLRVEGEIRKAEALLDEVRAVSGPRTFENTLRPHKWAKARLSGAQWLAGIGLNAHPDSAFRKFAQAWESRIAERSAALGADRAVYEALAALDPAVLDPEHRYVLDQELAAYRRNGVDHDAATRERVTALRARLTELRTRFERNIFTDVKTIRLDPDSLSGIPPDWIQTHASGPPGDDGRVAVQITQANFFPLVTFAAHGGVRAAGYQAAFGQGHPRNIAVIDSLRLVRGELAGLLGYPSWGAYAMEPTMAASPERVAGFLAEVDLASRAAAAREVEALLAVWRQEEPGATAVRWTDLLYLQNRLRQQSYGFDEQAMREYLPYARVRDGVLSSFERMFGLEFRPAEATPTWSENVEPYEVWEDGSLVGRFYLDMHPRDGKFGICGAAELRRGTGEVPEIALLCNLPGGNDGDPGLLSPREVLLLFHEFGHLMHFLSAGRSPLLGSFEFDFMEAPSQLFEEWARDPAVLQRFARHYRTGEPLPTELVAAYRRADASGRALVARILIWHSVLSLELFTRPVQTEPTAEVERRSLEYLPLSTPEWIHPASSVVHLSLYSSNYYTYLWSSVIARDLLTGFRRDDLLDPEAGRRYRQLVLAPTGTAPSAALVERFLGRPFNAAAWRAWLEDGEHQQ